MSKYSLLLAFLILAIVLPAQNSGSESPIIFIYDASGSMWGQMEGRTKKEIASEVLINQVSKLSDDQKIGLVAYGHRKKGDCEDVEFLVATNNGGKNEVTQALNGINPLGKTPLAYSALQVINQLAETGEKAKSEGIDFKLHIIGFGLEDGETQELRCAAKAGGGSYLAARDREGLADVLNTATQTTVAIPDNNFSIYAMKNGVAIDAWVKAYDIVGKRKPIAVRTYGDTAFTYLPPSQYRLEALPLGGSDVNRITVSVESFETVITHQTISFDGGKLGINTTNNGEGWDCVVK